MSQRTPLFDAHVAASAKMVDFSGWELPIHYGSLVEEHRAVREDVGMFDVSHMTVVDFEGEAVADYLRRLLTNDVQKMSDGTALYSCLCNERGGVIDDLIAYRISAEHYRLVVNAATRDKDLAWFRKHLSKGVDMKVPENLALIAVQGQNALAKADTALTALRSVSYELAEMQRFTARADGDWFVARTGYTGEDGVEIILPSDQAMALWQALLEEGVKPCGLGARDTLRLEAGLCLYGADLDEQHTPIESGIGWCVDLIDEERQFIGREVLEDHKLFGGRTIRVGVLLDSRGVLRNGQEVQLAGNSVGTITSGTFSPSRQESIGMARVSQEFKGGCDIIIRGKYMAGHRVPIPFVRSSQEID